MTYVRSKVEHQACRFCRIANGGSEHPYDEILDTSDRFFAIASVGSLVPGWVLICPKNHALNMSEHYGDPDLTSFRLEVAEQLSRRFESPVRMFEHGTAACSSPTGCGVDHAHVHLVAHRYPISEGITELPGSSDWRPIRASQVGEHASAEYLFYSDDAQNHDPVGAMQLLTTPTSQYFRRVIARQLGRAAEFDYREHPNLPNAIATTKALRFVATGL